MSSRTKHNDRKHHCIYCLKSFTKKEILNHHKKHCLLINGCQAVNYKSGTIKFTNYEKKKKYLHHLKYMLTQSVF